MDSFLHNHQAALDSQREDDAIQYLQDTGVYPNSQEDFWGDSALVTEYCQKCDCILRYDEGDICYSCEELEDKHYPMETDHE